MPKFNCSFSITASVEKTYVITNYEIDIPDEDAVNILTDSHLEDYISDEITTQINEGDFDPEEKGELIETDYTNSYPDFVKVPTKVEPKQDN